MGVNDGVLDFDPQVEPVPADPGDTSDLQAQRDRRRPGIRPIELPGEIADPDVPVASQVVDDGLKQKRVDCHFRLPNAADEAVGMTRLIPAPPDRVDGRVQKVGNVSDLVVEHPQRLRSSRAIRSSKCR